MYYYNYYNSPKINRYNELFLIESYDESRFIIIKKINTARTVSCIFDILHHFGGVFK